MNNNENIESSNSNEDSLKRAQEAQLRFKEGLEAVRMSMKSSPAVQSYLHVKEFLDKHGFNEDTEYKPSNSVEYVLDLFENHPDVKLHEALSELSP